MKTTTDLVKIYTGPEASTRLLKLRLEQIGIHALSKNDNTGAFMGLLPPSIDLWVNDDDYESAKQLIDDFITNQQSESEL